jgi:Holliday junction resolvase RusA-like endonuclease
MPAPKTVTFVLDGTIPSKKNSRINLKSGVSIPSKDFTTWQNDAIKVVRSQTRERFFNPVAMEVLLYFGSDARADQDNKLSSILDMLVEGCVLPDDKWQNVPQIVLQAEYRPRRPGAFVRLTDLGTDFLGAELATTRAKRPKRKQRI